MDVNNTRFHMIMGHEDWSPLINDSSISWDEDRCSIGLTPVQYLFKKIPGDNPPALEERRGAGVDRFGNWYWISREKSEIRFLPRGTKKPQHFWSVEDAVKTCSASDTQGAFRSYGRMEASEPLELRGLVITEKHYLVVGVLSPGGLLIFDLHAGGPPREMTWPRSVPFAPFDMAAAPDGGVCILDSGKEPRYWVLDKNLRIIPYKKMTLGKGDFRPVGIEKPYREDCSIPAGISSDLSKISAARNPVAVESLPDGSLLIMDSSPGLSYSTIYRYRSGSLLYSYPLEDALQGYIEIPPGEEHAVSYGVKGYDFAFIGDVNETSDVSGTLYIADESGNQAFAFKLTAGRESLNLELQIGYYPMRRFGGKGLVSDGTAVYYDCQERWLPLVEQKRPKYREEGSFTAGLYSNNDKKDEHQIFFDGKEPDCVWHRVFLDASIPSGGACVFIESRADNDKEMLYHKSWQAEPEPYLRRGGSEIPYYRSYGSSDENTGGKGTWETLLQNAKGRYLQLRLTLKGTRQNTPRIRALRVYYPRFSYLNEYLPAVYREDDMSADFLDRFLANAEGIFTSLEDRIAQAQILFDTESVPSEYLDWLAGWFGVMLDSSWDENRKRLFIAHAMRLFEQRGTLPGLMRAISIATDPCPDDAIFTDPIHAYCSGTGNDCHSYSATRHSVRIVEDFLTRRAPGVVFGDPTEAEGPGVTTEISDWTPEQGPQALHEKYTTYLKNRYTDVNNLNAAWEKGTENYTAYGSFNDLKMPPVKPVNSAAADDWKAFLKKEIGFTYYPVAHSDTDTKAYRDFLARRYRRMAVFSEKYQTAEEYGSFDRIPLPGKMPEKKLELHDWILFVSSVLPSIKKAHRFTVLVPTFISSYSEGKGPDPALVRRIVHKEKPAHTEFTVKEYWAMFRVGEARLGLDTQLDVGSRLAAIILGQSYLAEGHLAITHPWDVEDRIVVGRDRVNTGMKL